MVTLLSRCVNNLRKDRRAQRSPASQTLRPPQQALDAIALRDASTDMHPTRGTRIHPKGLESPPEGQTSHRDTGRIKAPFAGTICSTSFLRPLVFEHWRVAHSPECVEEGYCELRLNGVLGSSNCVYRSPMWGRDIPDTPRRTVPPPY
jgi:hypothetical protein